MSREKVSQIKTYIPPGKYHAHLIQQSRCNHQEPDLKRLRSKLKRRQQVVIPLIQSHRRGYRVIAERIREASAKGTPYTGADDLLAKVQYE